jgi:Tfp pilus assembly pilus retraction ATPase PilT
MSADPQLDNTQDQHRPRRIDEYLREVLVKGGSDLHFVAGDPARIRLHGDLQTLREGPLLPDMVRDMLAEIMTRQATRRLEDKDGADTRSRASRVSASTCSATSAGSAACSAQSRRKP